MLGFFLRADGASSPPVFDRRVPLRFAGGSGIPGVGFPQTQPAVGKSSQSRFKAVSTAGVSPLVLRMSLGRLWASWGLSEALQRGVGVCSSPVVLGGGWVVDGWNTL